MRSVVVALEAAVVGLEPVELVVAPVEVTPTAFCLLTAQLRCQTTVTQQPNTFSA